MLALWKFQKEVYFCEVKLIKNSVSLNVLFSDYDIGRTRSLVANWESRDQSPSYEGPTTSTSSVNIAAASMPYSSVCFHICC